MDSQWLDGRTVLITGGTGSFGRKFVEYVLGRFRVKKLIVFSRDELKQHEMRQTWDDATGELPIRYFVGDVRDKERMYRAMRGVDVVVHAAALKQVPSCEYNPFEAVQTNIVGAKNLIDAAIDCGVERVIALSTDKAVNPVNLYGATKLVAEKLFVQGNSYSVEGGTRFSCVRYGNVVGSRGSVLPLFLEQRKTGVVTVTDERMTRFWITLRGGVEFVVRCAEVMRGGEIFVPKLASTTVLNLVRAIAPECDIKYCGIRPGEKIHETLLSEDEARCTLERDDLYLIQPSHPWWRSDGSEEGNHLPDGFRYSSDTNPMKLSVDDLRAILDAERLC